MYYLRGKGVVMFECWRRTVLHAQQMEHNSCLSHILLIFMLNVCLCMSMLRRYMMDFYKYDCESALDGMFWTVVC